MANNLIEICPSAYAYPLLIKHILDAPLAYAARQEIVYRDAKRYSYRTLRERVGRLASGLTALGVRPGDTVAMMDWDSHRYLECFFTVPMMGAVLQTVKGKISHLAVPPRILIVDALERTSVGTLNKKAMREKYLGSSDAAPTTRR